MNQDVQSLIYLLSCAVNDITPNSVKLLNMNLEGVYKIAEKHMVSAAVAVSLECAGIFSPKFDKRLARAERKAIIYENEASQVISSLEKHCIWYMPLKGIILKDLYPKIGMREMADVDILVDKDKGESIKRIMLDLGFSVKSYGINNVDSYTKPPFSNIEIHKSLFGFQHDRKLYDYFSDIKTRLVKDENNRYGYHFNSNDFYLFMIAHEYKHYINGGTGLRSLLDTYIYINKNKLDDEYIKQETEKLGISEFEEINRKTALDLFRGAGVCDSELLDYIINSGTFGNVENLVQNNINKKGGKISYLFRRLFGYTNGNYWDYLKQRHPVFYKYKILLPLLPFYRVIYGIRKYPKRIKKELKALFSK